MLCPSGGLRNRQRMDVRLPGARTSPSVVRRRCADNNSDWCGCRAIFETPRYSAMLQLGAPTRSAGREGLAVGRCEGFEEYR